MAVNQFKIWSSAAGGYSATAYAALSNLATGVVPGIADPLQANASWRQCSEIAAMIGQFICDNTGEDAIDDGTDATLLANFIKAIQALTRIRLAAPLNIYIANTGTDAPGNGLAALTPFLTREYAWNFVLNNYDLNGQSVTFNLADGTYIDPFAAANLLVGQQGAPSATFVGNIAFPGNVTFSIAGSNIFNVSESAAITVKGMLLGGVTAGAGESGNAILVSSGGIVAIGTGIQFGTCGASHVRCVDHGYVVGGQAYTINGNAAFHMNCSAGVINISGLNITITGSVTMTSFYAATETGVIKAGAVTYTSTLSGGLQYTLTTNAVLQTGGLLGTIPGSGTAVSTGGEAQ